MVQHVDYIICHLARRGQIEIIQYLEEKGVVCTSLEDMLENSVRGGNLHLVQYVIENKGATVNGTDALHISITKKDFVIFKYLVSQGHIYMTTAKNHYVQH